MTRKLKIISLTTLSFWIVAGVAFSQTRDIKFKRISSRFNLSKASISCIHQDSRGFLWFGTFDGLYKYDGYRFTEYKNNPGNPYSLSHNEVRAICEDSSGKLWLATNNGLNRFNPQTESIKRYTEEDGLQSNKFNGTFHKNQQTGEMFLGGVNGFNTFFPYQIKDNTRLPKIAITDFQIFNKSVPVARPYTEQDSNDPSSFKLDKSIAATKELTLSYKERVFSFEFAALHYVNPEKNQYAYKMEGLDEDWNYIGVRRFTTFTNLSPGEYTFRVKGSNSDGVWNEQGTALKIIITPPRWKTWWAYTIYFLLISALIYGIKQFELSRARLKQELKLQHLHTEKLAEIDQMKSRFFANISHEFRTPLTLILGPLEKLLLDDFVEPVKKQFRVMHRNGKRLLRLINQLLDLSKLEAGGMSLQARPENIIKLLKGVVLAFSSLAERKQIDLRFQPPEDFESSQGSDSLIVYLDRDKFEKIISNLLSNAFKFTPAGGENSIKVLVADDIPLDPPSRGESKGEVTSVGDFHQDVSTLLELEEILDDVSSQPPEGSKPSGGSGLPPIILIVEDNADVRAYIRDYLNESYRVLEAEDGEKGFEKATELIPDLIISDVMMPKMDGYALCQKLKADEKTSHIPVILLTARASGESKVEGLETGADDYIIKPFDAKELQSRVKNLIQQRRKLRERWSREITLQPKDITITSTDEQFLQRAMEVVEKHISDPDFSTETFSDEFYMSRMQLNRKLQALTDQATGEFVRTLRLRRAAKLLEQKGGVTIVEIAYEVGFSSPAYFAKCFKELFGQLPSDYARHLK